MTAAQNSNGRSGDRPNISRGDAMRIVHWARKGQKKVDMYKTALYLLGFEKDGDKFHMEPEWVKAMVPDTRRFWDRAVMQLRMLDGKAPRFKGSGGLQAVWSEEAGSAWIRLQAERALKKRPRPIRDVKRGIGVVVIVLAIAFVLASRN